MADQKVSDENLNDLATELGDIAQMVWEDHKPSPGTPRIESNMPAFVVGYNPDWPEENVGLFAMPNFPSDPNEKARLVYLAGGGMTHRKGSVPEVFGFFAETLMYETDDMDDEEVQRIMSGEKNLADAEGTKDELLLLVMARDGRAIVTRFPVLGEGPDALLGNSNVTITDADEGEFDSYLVDAFWDGADTVYKAMTN